MTKKRNVKVAGRVRVNTYEIISRAVNEGVVCGLSRAHKHTDKPDRAAIGEAIETAVMGSLCDVLVFDDGRDE